MAESVTLKERIRDWYFSNDNVTARDVSEHFDIPYETARIWIRDGAWIVKKTMRDYKMDDLPDDILTQASGIRLVLYKAITGGEHLAEDLQTLVETWLKLVAIGGDNNEDLDRDALLEELRGE
ncbi:MAG: hypothetical protein GWN62_03685 [Aliifodinibius sp.]|nr:hypothetical protein [Fodinibius sp.]